MMILEHLWLLALRLFHAISGNDEIEQTCGDTCFVVFGFLVHRLPQEHNQEDAASQKGVCTLVSILDDQHKCLPLPSKANATYPFTKTNPSQAPSSKRPTSFPSPTRSLSPSPTLSKQTQRPSESPNSSPNPSMSSMTPSQDKNQSSEPTSFPTSSLRSNSTDFAMSLLDEFPDAVLLAYTLVHNFSLNLISYEQEHDISGISCAAGFGVFNVENAPFPLVDRSVPGAMEHDGIIRSNDEFFGIVDTAINGHHDPAFWATWTFDIGAIPPETTVYVRIDVAAMGSAWEYDGTLQGFTEEDFFILSYENDQVVLSSRAEAGENITYTLESGKQLSSTGVLYVGETMLNNNLRSFTVPLPELSTTQVDLNLTAASTGDDKAIVFQNIALFSLPSATKVDFTVDPETFAPPTSSPTTFIETSPLPDWVSNVKLDLLSTRNETSGWLELQDKSNNSYVELFPEGGSGWEDFQPVTMGAFEHVQITKPNYLVHRPFQADDRISIRPDTSWTIILVGRNVAGIEDGFHIVLGPSRQCNCQIRYSTRNQLDVLATGSGWGLSERGIPLPHDVNQFHVLVLTQDRDVGGIHLYQNGDFVAEIAATDYFAEFGYLGAWYSGQYPSSIGIQRLSFLATSYSGEQVRTLSRQLARKGNTTHAG